MQISERIIHIEKEIQTMALTLADVKAKLKEAEAHIDASLSELKGEIAVLQQGTVAQADLDELNQVAVDLVDKAQAMSDLIPNTPSASSST